MDPTERDDHGDRDSNSLYPYWVGAQGYSDPGDLAAPDAVEWSCSPCLGTPTTLDSTRPRAPSSSFLSCAGGYGRFCYHISKRHKFIR